MEAPTNTTKEDWNYGKIYMHKVTYHIACLRFPTLEKYFIPLAFGEECVISEMTQKEVDEFLLKEKLEK